jgi:tetratricopeptide (TPR) repeat protein
MRKSYLIAIVVSVALGLIVLFLLFPTQPKSALDKANSPIADSVKIQQAIELVNGPQPMQGIQMLLSMVEENPKNVEAHFVLGEFAIRSGQMEKAVARFNTIIELQPQNTLAYIYKGEALMQMDSLQAALATFKGAIATDSTSGIALVYAGKMNEQLGNFSEAKTLYNQILRHNEDPIVRDSVNAFIKKIDIKLNNK